MITKAFIRHSTQKSSRSWKSADLLIARPGAIDTAGAVVLTIAFAAARQAARVARLRAARA